MRYSHKVPGDLIPPPPPHIRTSNYCTNSRQLAPFDGPPRVNCRLRFTLNHNITSTPANLLVVSRIIENTGGCHDTLAVVFGSRCRGEEELESLLRQTVVSLVLVSTAPRGPAPRLGTGVTWMIYDFLR